MFREKSRNLVIMRRLYLKCDGIRAETRFRLSAKRTSSFKSAGASFLSNTGSRGVRISGSNAGYTMFRGSVKSTGYPLHSSVQSTTGSRGVRISGSNAGYTMFRGSLKGTGYPLHSPVSPSLPFPCVTVCHHISTGLYHRENKIQRQKQDFKIMFREIFTDCFENEVKCTNKL